MVRKIFKKLVRDRIPIIIKKNGEHAIIRKLPQQEFRIALKEKLTEEAKEVLHATKKEELIKEIADVQEVLRAIAIAWKISPKEIETVRLERLKKRGGFAKKIFLIETR